MPNKEDNPTNYNGYPLFVESAEEERHINRANIMANITEDHQDKGRVSRQGMGLILGYFGKIPSHERGLALTSYREELTKRGVAYAQ